MSATPMMKCGHSANAKRVMPDGSRVPSCAICAGLTPDSLIVVDAPDFTGRRARCSYFGTTARGQRTPCASEVDSSSSCAFFEHRPDAEFDLFYCGCWGWD